MIPALKRQPQALRVQMSIAAQPHAVALEQLQYLRALVAVIFRRIVQKAELFRIARRLERCFQPSQLPPEHLFIVRPLLVLLVEPAARSAQGGISVK